MTTSNLCVFCIHSLRPPLFQPSFECFYPYAQASSLLSTTVTNTTTTTGGGGNPLPWRRFLRCDSCCGRFKRRRKSSMMCRSARLTRLRTAKHGSGISGKPVMVHRCQGEYFRQLLKPITGGNVKLLMHYSKNLYEGLAGPVSSPGTMNSTSTPDRGAVCAVNPFAEGFRFQSSQPNLKRFVMFDHSGGKGRVFFHPALAQELFGPAQHWESNGVSPVKEHSKPSTNLPSLKVAQSDLKLKAYRELVGGAFASLQTLRSSRLCEMASKHQQISNPMVSETLASSGKPGVSDAIGTARYPRDLDSLAMAHAQSPLASGILDCEEKLKDCEEKRTVSAALLSPERFRVAEALTSSVLMPFPSRSQISGAKRPVENTAGERMREITEDLDALLSSDEDDDDEEVRSTGHSPDEPLGIEESCDGDEDNEVLQFTSKKRRVDEQEGKVSLKEVGSGEEVNDKRSFEHRYHTGQSSRRHKIKRTVKALRKMIPGGAFLDAALVLDETILYVKTLRERVSQLEATRFQTQA